MLQFQERTQLALAGKPHVGHIDLVAQIGAQTHLQASKRFESRIERHPVVVVKPAGIELAALPKVQIDRRPQYSGYVDGHDIRILEQLPILAVLDFVSAAQLDSLPPTFVGKPFAAEGVFLPLNVRLPHET